MKKKVLFVATYGGFFTSFEINNMKILQKMGYEIHCAANFDNINYNPKNSVLLDLGVIEHNIPFDRSPYNLKNYKLYKKLELLIKENSFELLDTHNPVVSIFSRKYAYKYKVPHIIYTAHGFFFFKGAPLKNKLIFKTMEKVMAKKTDVIITINKEDFIAAKKMKIRKKAVYVPGIGVDIDAIDKIEVDREKKLKSINVDSNKKIIIMVGELIPRKNYFSAFRALKELDEDYVCLICGQGIEKRKWEEYVQKNGFADKVKFLGFRNDVVELLKCSDLFLFTSFQEGLPAALMEAMSCSLPCIVSSIRGNIDLIDENGGFLINPKNYLEVLKALRIFFSLSEEKILSMKRHNKQIIENFSLKKVDEIMKEIYMNELTSN